MVERFFPAPNPDVYVGDFPAQRLTDGVDVVVRFDFKVPSDFGSLSSANVVFVPGGSGDIRYSVLTDFGQICVEDYDVNSDSIAASTQAVVQDDVECIDIAAALPGLAADDLVGVAFTRTGAHVDDTVGADVYLLGLVLDYDPPGPTTTTTTTTSTTTTSTTTTSTSTTSTTTSTTTTSTTSTSTTSTSTSTTSTSTTSTTSTSTSTTSTTTTTTSTTTTSTTTTSTTTTSTTTTSTTTTTTPVPPAPFFCCPFCHDASTHIWRVGPVGVRGIDDSRRFFCEACGVFFTMGGETFWEAHGRLE